MEVSVAFYKASRGNWKDKVVAFWTGGDYSHTELVFHDPDTGELIMWSSSPIEGKVRKKKHTIDTLTWDYLHVEVPNPEAMMASLEEVRGERYDWLGVLGFAIPLKDREGKWFCSELVSNALKVGGVAALYSYDPSDIGPNVLYELLEYK